MKFKYFNKYFKKYYSEDSVFRDTGISIEEDLKMLEQNYQIIKYSNVFDMNENQIAEFDILQINPDITIDKKPRNFKVEKYLGAFCIVSEKVQGIADAFEDTINDNVMPLFEILLRYNNSPDNTDIIDTVKIIGNTIENPNIKLD